MKHLLIYLFVFFQAFTSIAQNAADPSIKSKESFDPKRPLERELQMHVLDGLTIASVGDCIISRPLSQYAERDPGFASVVKVLKESDAAYGNLETTIFDARNFHGYPFSWEGDWTLVSDVAVARDLAALGFDLFSRANNHALDWGLEGMRETSRSLDDNHLIHAGAGENEAIARSAQYYESSKGRIAIVSMASTFRPTTNALSPHGSAPARPGISGLNVKRIIVVPENVMQSLRSVHQSLLPDKKIAETQPQTLSLFGNVFEVGKAFHFRYEMDPADLSAILKAIRQGKENADFLFATIHSHESLNEDFPDLPAEFLSDLAHQAIDAGADAFFTTGIHHVGPIEVYKGRPIFYGLGNFFWSDIQEPLPADLYNANREKLAKAFDHPERATDADLGAVLNAESFNNEITFETIIAQSRFFRGRLSEVRIYPIDLGYGRTLTESGIPRIAAPQKARKILERLQKISQPYGTRIVIENNLGMIRP